jgi:hypothetical protein
VELLSREYRGEDVRMRASELDRSTGFNCFLVRRHSAGRVSNCQDRVVSRKRAELPLPTLFVAVSATGL